jgi:uncharacterized Zn-binding protein involved in type VI secretion
VAHYIQGIKGKGEIREVLCTGGQQVFVPTCGSCGDPRSYGCGAPICTGSSTFLVEGLPVARLLDSTFTGIINSTSQYKVLADGLPVASLLDTTTCGFINQVSNTTFLVL